MTHFSRSSPRKRPGCFRGHKNAREYKRHVRSVVCFLSSRQRPVSNTTQNGPNYLPKQSLSFAFPTLSVANQSSIELAATMPSSFGVGVKAATAEAVAMTPDNTAKMPSQFSLREFHFYPFYIFETQIGKLPSLSVKRKRRTVAHGLPLALRVGRPAFGRCYLAGQKATGRKKLRKQKGPNL